MNILLKENLPYLFTILIGLAAYQINNLISINTDSPILSYKFHKVNVKNVEGNIESELECHLINYSRKSALKDIQIHASYKSSLPNPKKVDNPNIIAVAPSTILADTMTNAAFGLINEYRIPIIHPYSEYILTMNTTTNPIITEYPKLYLNSNQSIRLVNDNFEIFLIRNQIALNIGLLFLWVIFTLVYLFFLIKKN